MIQVIGKLVDYALEYKGSSGFPVGQLELDVNGRPVGLNTVGPTAERFNALLADAPEGCLVEVYAVTSYSTNKDGDRTFLDIEATDVLILGTVGQPSANFKVQGFIQGVREVPKREGGSFFMGVLQEIAYSRQGPVPGAVIELSLGDEELSTWRTNIGNFAFVRGKLSGYKSDNGRIWPRFNADSLSVSPVPSWLVEYAPTPEEPEEEAPVVEEESPLADLGFSFE